MSGERTAMPVRVLILWADNRSANLGVRALAQGAGELVSRAWPDSELVFQDLGANDQGFSITMGTIKGDIRRWRGPIRSWLATFDVIVDTGAGDSFADIYGRTRLTRIIYTQLAARVMRVPVILGPQTIGPFDNRWARLAARFAASRARAVFARDSASLAYGESLRIPRLGASTDVVFGLHVPEAIGERDVVLNVSGLLWGENRHVDSVAYRRAIRSLIDGLLDADRQVSLVAHVVENPSKDNDLIAIADLVEEYGDRVESVVPSSLDEVRGILRGSAVVVGSRMHACLNAISVGTPAIPWAYSRKFAPLLSDLQWPVTIDLRDDADPVPETLELLARDAESWKPALASVRTEADRRLEALTEVFATLGPRKDRASAS